MSTTEGSLSIGEVAGLTGTPATTLRYYESKGLIDPPPRVGGQRRYGPDVLGRLMVIRFCRVAGLPLDLIATVIADTSPKRSRTRALASAQVIEIDTQIEQLQLARRMMVAASRCVCPTLEICDCGAMSDVTAELQDLVARGGPPTLSG